MTTAIQTKEPAMSVTPAVLNPERSHRSHRLLIVLGIAVPFAASRMIGPWAEPLLPAAFGIACAISVARRRPLLATVAAKRAAAKPALAARISAPGVAPALATMTVVWAFVLIAEAAVLAALASSARSVPFATLSTLLTWGIQAVLVAATIVYARSRRLAAQAVR